MIQGIKTHGDRIRLGFTDDDTPIVTAIGPYLQSLVNRLTGGGGLDFNQAFGAGREGEIDRSLVTRIQDAINLRDFAVGDGVTDDTAKVQLALTRAVDQGRALYVPYGSFRVTAPMVAEGGLVMYGPGEFYVDGDDLADEFNGIFEIDIDPLADLAITEIDNAATFDASNGFSIPSPCARIRPASIPASLVAGSVCKIVSEDELGIEAGKFRGEFFRVLAVSGADIYTTSPLQDTYTTNPSMVVLDSEQRVHIEGLNIRANYPALVANNWKFAFLRITGAVVPSVVDLHMRDGGHNGIWFRGCYGHRTLGVSARRFRNAVSSQTIAGYGIQDGGCALGAHIGLYGEDCRHVYTTVGHTAATQPKVCWGRNRGHVVANGTALGCSSTPFDCHPDAEGLLFVGCSAKHGYLGETAAHAGFQLRGRNNVIVGCRTEDHSFGVIIHAQFASEINGRHLIKDLTYRGKGHLVRTVPEIGPVSFIMDEPDCDTTDHRMCRLYWANVHFRNPRFRSTADDTSFLRMIDMGLPPTIDEEGLIPRPDKDLVVTCEGGEFDFRDSAATDVRVAFVQTEGFERDVEVTGLRILAGSNDWRGVVVADELDSPVVTAKFDVVTDRMPIFISTGEVNPSGVRNLNAASTVNGHVGLLSEVAGRERMEIGVRIPDPVNGDEIVLDLNTTVGFIESLAYVTTAGSCTVTVKVADSNGANTVNVSGLVGLSASTTLQETLAEVGNSTRMGRTGTSKRRLFVTLASVTGMVGADLRLTFRAVRA